MTLSGFASNLRAFAAGLGIGRDKAVQEALAVVMQRMLTRIFQQGKKADGAALGRYTSEGYIYKRRQRGLQTGYVDLKFTGELMRGVVIIKTSQGYAIAVRGPHAETADFVEARYGATFKLTQEERAQLEAELRRRVRNLAGQSGLKLS